MCVCGGGGGGGGAGKRERGIRIYVGLLAAPFRHFTKGLVYFSPRFLERLPSLFVCFLLLFFSSIPVILSVSKQ